MSVSTRMQSSQSASPYALSPHFVRQLRNFMNNWIVEGGSFRFDGYRTYLKVDPQTSTRFAFLDHPWRLYQKDEDAPGLIVNMLPGLVSGAMNDSNQVNMLIPQGPLTVTDDATTIVWVKLSFELRVWTTYFKVWAISASSTGSGASLPADTLDLGTPSTMTAGDVYTKIGSIEAADGELVTITQNLFTPVNYTFPPILYGPASGIHVLVSNDGVVGWVGTVDDPPCP